MQNELSTHYQTLGVTSSFPSEAVDGLRRSLSKLYHPDSGSRPDAEWMRRINAACDVLGDPVLRMRYDEGLRLTSDKGWTSRSQHPHASAVHAWHEDPHTLPRNQWQLVLELVNLPFRLLGFLVAAALMLLGYVVPLAMAAAGAWFVYLGVGLVGLAQAKHAVATIHAGNTLTLAWAVSLLVIVVGAAIAALALWMLALTVRDPAARRSTIA
ncbi:MAG: DnaJ domain-containing protein [Solirubrobacteraceae bacterium]|jgi:hypothetical protein